MYSKIKIKEKRNRFFFKERNKNGQREILKLQMKPTDE